MKILIVSDTHRKDEYLRAALECESPIDVLIHLGDSEGSEQQFQRWLPLSTRFVAVKGNNDFFSELESERELEIAGRRCFLTHGHYYNVSLDTALLCQEAASRGCEVAMFGHTHRPLIETRDGVLLLNPGSISYPRQEGRGRSYIVAEAGKDGELRCELRFLKCSGDGRELL